MENKISIIEKMKYRFDIRDELVSNLRWKDKRKGKILITTNLTREDWALIDTDIRIRKEQTKLQFVVAKALKYFWKKNSFFKKGKKKIKKGKKRIKLKKTFFKKDIIKIFFKRLPKNKKKFNKRGKILLKKKFLWAKKVYLRKLNEKKLRNKKLLTCIISVKHTFSNFFIVITDIKGKVIGYCSSGQVCDSNNIKRKKSYFLVNPMMNRLVPKLRKLNIKNVRIRIKSNITHHMRKVVQFLQNGGFKIQHIRFAKPIPHHFGQRRRKLKRL